MENVFNNLSKEGKEEILEAIANSIKDGRLDNTDVSEVHHIVFNTDYFIIGRYKAKKWIEKHYGVFEAIEAIKEYEQFNFGEVTTDFSQPENVCNMLVYIAGEQALNNCDKITNNWDCVLSDELEGELLEEIE